MKETISSGDAREGRRRDLVDSTAFEVLVITVFLTQAGIGGAVWRGWFWLAVPLVLLASHFMHGLIIGFHEASHGLLRRSRLLNEFDGLLLGFFSFLPFSLYRVVHQTHHIHLTREGDEEFWPLSIPGMPRWVRRLAAFLELNMGLFYAPLIFLRAFLRRGSTVRSRKVRRRIWTELVLMVVVWSAILLCVAHWGVWKYFLWIYLLPAFLAANLQSWRKYIEHVGLTGDTVNSATRSIIPQSWLGRLMSFTLLHEPFHGVHHEDAGLPHAVYAEHAAMLNPVHPGERAPFQSYRQVLPELLRSLANPHVGPQWRAVLEVQPRWASESIRV